MALTFGSLFAGIGGIDLGLERAGMSCRWQVELDPFCTNVLEKHWPDVKRYSDITLVHGDQLESVDLIAGGFPCQDLSIAGKRAGIDGQRSGLWSHFARLVGQVRPRFVLIENVPGLLANQSMRRVLGDLSACGYDAEWQCLSAAFVGASHIRDRVFLVAYPADSGLSIFTPEDAGSPGSARIQRTAGRDIAAASADIEQPRLEGNEFGVLAQGQFDSGYATRCGGGSFGFAPNQDHPLESSILRSVHGVPGRVDQVRSLGNSVVPQVAEWVGQQILLAAQRASTPLQM